MDVNKILGRLFVLNWEVCTVMQQREHAFYLFSYYLFIFLMQQVVNDKSFGITVMLH